MIKHANLFSARPILGIKTEPLCLQLFNIVLQATVRIVTGAVVCGVRSIVRFGVCFQCHILRLIQHESRHFQLDRRVIVIWT